MAVWVAALSPSAQAFWAGADMPTRGGSDSMPIDSAANDASEDGCR